MQKIIKQTKSKNDNTNRASLMQKIFSVKNEGTKKVVRILGLKIKIKNKKLILRQDIQKLSDDAKKLQTQNTELTHKITQQTGKIAELFQQTNQNAKLIQEFKQYKKFSAQIKLKRVEIHLVEHCNLNCQCCDHFSPLAEKEFLSIEEFEKDIKRLSKVLDGNLKELGLLGGEPLLHPELVKFSPIARKYFPNTNIQVTTNGILLEKQSDDFWNACRDFDIEISATKYPININWEHIMEIVSSKNCRFSFFYGSGKTIKTSYIAPLDLNGEQNKRENFANCSHANNCVFLTKGRLYTCTIAPNIKHFNKYFNKNIPLTEADSIDIYKAQNEEEILNFLAKPIPFCKYCDIKRRKSGFEWKISKKDISEWTIPETEENK